MALLAFAVPFDELVVERPVSTLEDGTTRTLFVKLPARGAAFRRRASSVGPVAPVAPAAPDKDPSPPPPRTQPPSPLLRVAVASSSEQREAAAGSSGSASVPTLALPTNQSPRARRSRRALSVVDPGVGAPSKPAPRSTNPLSESTGRFLAPLAADEPAKEYACKVVDQRVVDKHSDFKSHFRRYLRRCACVSGAPLVGTVARIVEEPPAFAVLTKWRRAGSLRDQLDRPSVHNKLPWKRRWQIATDVARAIEFLHGQGEAHGNLKASNIFIDEDDAVQVCELDFGLGLSRRSQPWASPEIRSGGEISAEGDVFAFGVLLWEMCTLRRPEASMSLSDYAQSFPAEAPGRFIGVALQCLEYAASARANISDIISWMVSSEDGTGPLPQQGIPVSPSKIQAAMLDRASLEDSANREVPPPRRVPYSMEPPPDAVKLYSTVHRSTGGRCKYSMRMDAWQAPDALMTATLEGSTAGLTLSIAIHGEETVHVAQLRSTVFRNTFRLTGYSSDKGRDPPLLAVIRFASTTPRTMKVTIPDGDNVTEIESRAAHYDESQKIYRLDFGGRVKVPSIKNFQLVRPAAPNQVLIQFGKVETDVFSLDFTAPLSPLVAFALALSSFYAVTF